MSYYQGLKHGITSVHIIYEGEGLIAKHQAAMSLPMQSSWAQPEQSMCLTTCRRASQGHV